MLILRRTEGQWLEVRHRSGDVLRILVARSDQSRHNHRKLVLLGFEDADRLFEISRPDAATRRPLPQPIAAEPAPEAGR